MLPITTFYLSLLLCLFLFLSINVIRTRRSAEVSLGTGENSLLERRIRAHGNFVEYTPIGIIMLGLIEGLETHSSLLHFIGVSLSVGRILHAIALSRSKPFAMGRVGGMVMTLTALSLGVIVGLANVFRLL